MIQGKSCTLTVAKDGEYYPLPYSEETVRTASKGYALPGVIGIRHREKRVITGKTIQGCVVTRLEENNVLALFLLLFYSNEKFDLLADRNAYRLVYKNLSLKEFELRGENKEPLYLRLDVKENDDSYTTSWDLNTPDLKWIPTRTFNFDGHKEYMHCNNCLSNDFGNVWNEPCFCPICGSKDYVKVSVGNEQ